MKVQDLDFPASYGVHHKHQALHDKINLKIAGGVETLGDSGFLSFFRVFFKWLWQTQLPFLKLTVSHLKWMVGRWSFPFGARPIFRGEVLVLGRVLVGIIS